MKRYKAGLPIFWETRGSGGRQIEQHVLFFFRGNRRVYYERRVHGMRFIFRNPFVTRKSKIDAATIMESAKTLSSKAIASKRNGYMDLARINIFFYLCILYCCEILYVLV